MSLPLNEDTRTQNRLFNKILHDNIILILNEKKINHSTQFATILTNNGYVVDQNSLSSYFSKNGTPKSQIPIRLLRIFCDIFNVDIYELFEQLTPEELKKIANRTQDDVFAANRNIISTFQECLAKSLKMSSDKFILSDKTTYNGYCQKYYGYFHPTLSNEDKILTSTLSFTLKDTHCQIDLTLDTGEKKIDGSKICKTYSGILAIVPDIFSCYCILINQDTLSTNEMCFFNFRYIPIASPSRNLDCRMIEVSTTSAGGDSKTPTVHRMFISREKIKDEDISLIAPHLYMNNSSILIEENHLLKVASFSPEYRNAVTKILRFIEHENYNLDDMFSKLEKLKTNSNLQLDLNESVFKTYHFKEDLIRSIDKNILDKRQMHEFISCVREYSISTKYNKVSKKLDDNIRKILLNNNYYKH